MTVLNDLINDNADASFEASAPSFSVSFFIQNHLIKFTKLSLSSNFNSKIYGDSSLTNKIFSWVEQYLDKKDPSISLPLDLKNLTPFSRIGLRAIKKISFGTTASYKETAEAAGNPKAARAIGGVCNRNPFPLIIPCHRVIASNQKIGGFAYDIKLKIALLNFECN